MYATTGNQGERMANDVGAAGSARRVKVAGGPNSITDSFRISVVCGWGTKPGFGSRTALRGLLRAAGASSVSWHAPLSLLARSVSRVGLTSAGLRTAATHD